MKLFANKNNSKSDKIAKLAAVGVTLLFVAAVVYITDPVHLIVEWQLSLQPGTLMNFLWQNPPVEVFIKVYMFNYTNVAEFREGRASKLKVEELGPYVYQEHLVNHNVSFNANGTVTFAPRRQWLFVREKSVGDPHVDQVIAPNIPYMGLTTAAAGLSTFGAIALSALTRRLNSQPLIHVPVHEYLWGYEDHLVHLASKFVPSFIDFQSFGILERMFNEGNNTVTLNLPKNDHKGRGFSIDNWNGAHGLKKWEYKDDENATYCNKLQGAYDGTLYPRDIVEGDSLHVYRTTFCRPLPIKNAKPVMFDGVNGFEFSLDDHTFDTDLGDAKTSCYCKGNKCLQRGLAPVTPCYYNIPLAISFPHFLNGDPSLLKPFEGLAPNRENHGSRLIIQPDLGVPMHLHTRFQANQVVEKIKFNSVMSKFEHMTLPILWVDVNIEKLPDFLVLLLKLLYKVCPAVQWALIISLTLVSISMLAGALLLCFWHPSIETKTEEVGRKILPMLPLLKGSNMPSTVNADCEANKDEAQILMKSAGAF